jgi:hypothetical protein
MKIVKVRWLSKVSFSLSLSLSFSLFLSYFELSKKHKKVLLPKASAVTVCQKDQWTQAKFF